MLYLSIFFSFVYKEPDEIFGECLRFRPTIYRFIQPKANVYRLYLSEFLFISIQFIFEELFLTRAILFGCAKCFQKLSTEVWDLNPRPLDCLFH